jgi:hypothetical protein
MLSAVVVRAPFARGRAIDASAFAGVFGAAWKQAMGELAAGKGHRSGTFLC